jgi:hypothetical protein
VGTAILWGEFIMEAIKEVIMPALFIPMLLGVPVLIGGGYMILKVLH